MNTTIDYTDPYPFEDFAPTLSQCFVIVIVGYLLSKFEILTSSDVTGIIALASYFGMPGIICMSLMKADFSDFRWELLFGILLGKTVIFVSVACFWIMFNGNIGVASIIALFCTQSNDLPVGNPLMSSLYRNYRPQMMKYLFFIPAMTGIVFIPMSNIMLKIHRERQKGYKLRYSNVKKWWKYIRKEDILNQLRGIAINPVVIATVCGLVLNFALKDHIPEVLLQPIKVAAITIPGVALLMLGFSFVHKEKYLLSSAIVPAVLFIILKMVITPILLHSIVKVLTEESKSSKLMSDFALLYGIVSPATTIFLSGRDFRKALAVMSVALILSSLSCFPMSYVIARVTIVPGQNFCCYVSLLKVILFWIACTSICCNVISGILIRSRKQWQQNYLYILNLLFIQIIICSGFVLWSIMERQAWTTYCEMILYYGGEISGYLWTGTLSVVLVLKQKHWMLTKKGFFFTSCMAWSVSAVMTVVMCFLIPYNAIQTVYVLGRVRTNFEFLQLVMTSIFLFISLIVLIVCVTHHFKNTKETEKIFTEVNVYDNTAFNNEECELTMQIPNSKELKCNEKVKEEGKTTIEIDGYCEGNLKNSESKSDTSIEEREWRFRLSSLLILLGVSMFVKFFANLYKLVGSKALEVMIPLEFLQSTLFMGQGIFILFIFGIDIRTIVISLRKWFWKIIHKEDDVVFDNVKSCTKDDEQTPFCKQFCKFYYSRCFTDIAKDRRWKNMIYEDSFWGHQLVDWLITEGLCRNEVDAEEQGQTLLESGVIQPVSPQHHFYDAPYLYKFVKESLNDERCVKF